MSKEKNISKQAKNSNLFELPRIPEDLKEINLTPSTTLSLTMSEPGAFAAHAANAASKKELKLMKKSWVYSKTKKGEWQSPNGLPMSEYIINALRSKFIVKVDKKTKPGQWRPLKDGQKPKNYFEGEATYHAPRYHDCVRKMNINNDALLYYASLDSCPYTSKAGRKAWESLTDTQRIYLNLMITAGNARFSYEVIQ